MVDDGQEASPEIKALYARTDAGQAGPEAPLFQLPQPLWTGE
jgi:hypothetical protein